MTKKTVKKKRRINRKLKKAICTTMSAIFMVSAIAVAAIPVENLQATQATTHHLDPYGSEDYIPDFSESETVYTSNDGMFQFVRVPDEGIQVAVIVGYSANRTLPGGLLEIPSTIDGYLSFNNEYIAANVEGNPLYFSEDIERGTGVTEEVQVTDEAGNPMTDENGDPITVTKEIMETVTVYHPCYYNDTYRDKWINLNTDQFYCKKTQGALSDIKETDEDGDSFEQTTTNNKKWVKGLTLRYIANNDFKTEMDNDGIWKLTVNNSSEEGVFSKAGNVTTLKTSDDLLGIGKYAFYGCGTLSGIQLSNGTRTIHDYAFADCINLQSVDIDLNANLPAIGMHAFQNCMALRGFVLPKNVREIGDGAFEGCSALQSITLTGGDDYNVQLSMLGDHVFKNCSSLRELTFPNGVKQAEGIAGTSDLSLTLIEGCTELASITTTDGSMTFAGSEAEFQNFLASVSDKFYFAGYNNSALHTTATDNEIAFKYLDDPYLYEKVVKEKDENGQETGNEIVYRVDENNNLQYFEMKGDVENVEIPGAIGPYNILTIGSDSFQNNCHIKKITIPSSITSIETHAFQGCHNLKDVIFEEPVNLTAIGAGAFNTQVVENGKVCEAGIGTCVDNVNAVSQPVLTFTGPISPGSVPFQYAMDPANTINRGTQQRTYITYFSGWPTNLTVQYNPDTGMSELVDYPRYSDLRSGNLKPKDTTLHGDSYPYLTSDQKAAAAEAVAAYENFKNGNGSQPTQDQWDIVNAALSIVIPDGVESFAEGLFSGIGTDGTSVSGNSTAMRDDYLKSITMNGVKSVPAYAFYGCQGLQSVIMNSSGSAEGDRIGAYAFGNCDELTNVSLSGNVTDLGLRPFRECEKLTYVEFNDSPYFVCDNGIIFGLKNGAKNSIIECLETRGKSGQYSIGTSMVTRAELAGVESIQDEAFMGCTGIGDVDLTDSSVETIPVSCFQDTTSLFSVEIPSTTLSIEKYAFKNSAVRSLTIPQKVTYFDPTIFVNEDGSVNKNIVITCQEDSPAYRYAIASGLTIGELLPQTFEVTFLSYDETTIIDKQDVAKGGSAVAPTAPEREGYQFVKWSPDYTNVSRDLTVVPYYELDTNSLIHTVTFLDYDRTELDVQQVLDGARAYPPEVTPPEGFKFAGWSTTEYENVTSDLIVIATYELVKSDGSGDGTSSGGDGTSSGGDGTSSGGDGSSSGGDGSSSGGDGTSSSGDGTSSSGDGSSSNSGTGTGTDTTTYYTVTFYDYNQTVLVTQQVAAGGAAVTPVSPTREGYTFTGWMPSYTNVTRDLDVFAQYEKKSATGKSTSTSSSASSSSSGSDSASTGSTASGQTYVVTVENGSGAGSYTAGSTVTLSAFDLPGKTFTNWATTATDIMISDVTSKITTFIMPAHAVNVVAKFSTSTTTTGRVAGASISGNAAVRRTLTNDSGTVVSISKSGISNKQVASASVSGSSDNFVVKISDDESARALLEQALLAEYGSLDNIKYFAMDISLYDSTGQNKINNTDGLTVTVTIPLPDALIEYAGNNKVASVSDGRLDKMTTRFMTIDGVPCVSFTAKHFSPYGVYVDTANLTAGTYQDSTPRTGDPIHPKWFLVIGLALLSILMFGAGGSKKKVVIQA